MQCWLVGGYGGGHRRLCLLRKPYWSEDMDEWELGKGWERSGSHFLWETWPGGQLLTSWRLSGEYSSQVPPRTSPARIQGGHSCWLWGPETCVSFKSALGNLGVHCYAGQWVSNLHVLINHLESLLKMHILGWIQ